METAKFDKPPLNEVVMGVSFAPIKGLHAQDIGRFWGEIADKYPESEQAINYGEPVPLDEGEIYPAPRFWFITETLDKLVQIQSNLFLCNWRKVGGKGIYPEYGEMKNDFKENYSLFLKFLKESRFDEPVHTELQFTYVNHFTEGPEWKKVSDLTHIVNLINFPDALGDKGIKDLNLNYIYNLPDKNKGIIRMKFSYAKKRSTDEKIIIFENDARGLDAENDDIYQWFDYAHEQLVNNFEQLTDDTMQKRIWGKR